MPLLPCLFSLSQIQRGLKNLRYTLMVSPSLNQIRMIRSKVDPGNLTATLFGDDGVIPADAPVETTIGVSAGEVVLERVLQQPLRVKVSFNAASTGFGGRTFTSFEFKSVSDREFFIAALNHLGIVPPTMPRHLVSTPVASTPCVAPVMKPVFLWGSTWPVMNVKIVVGT